MDVDRQAMHDAVERLAEEIETEHQDHEGVYTTTLAVIAHVGFTDDGEERDRVATWCTDDRQWAQTGFFRRAMLNTERVD